MRNFLKALFNIARFFLLFEKSVVQGYKDDVCQELTDLKKELTEVKNACTNNIKEKKRGA